MKILVATLGIGKGSFGHVARIISEEEWDKILLVGNDWAKENFNASKEADWILVNNRAPVKYLKEEISKKLSFKEISVCIASGSGKEHTALLSVIKDKEIDYKFILLSDGGIKYF